MKFKVGDLVKIKHDGWGSDGMPVGDYWAGKQGVITEISPSEDGVEIVVSVNGDLLCFTEGELEKV